MFRKTILALTATIALGVAALAPTAASAGGGHHHGHHGHHGWHGKHWGFGSYNSAYFGGCYKTKRLVETPFGLRLRFVTVCG